MEFIHRASLYQEMFLKICNFKKGIRIKSEKVSKQVSEQILWKQVEGTAQGLL